MASTEEQVFLGSRNLSYHSAHYPDASADWDYPEDPGDRREGVEVAELHDQPARMSTCAYIVHLHSSFVHASLEFLLLILFPPTQLVVDQISICLLSPSSRFRSM
uniref:Uncharacterized protein n=1 Tax=Aegilops tauschii subsp. strangulata TaxID=200361 RepID=A0A452XPJ5_AEGTS